jgi:hypothetical protein
MTTPVNVVGANRTLIVAGGVQKILGGLVDGRVKVCFDTIASSSTLDVGSTVKLGALPAGANVLAIILSATTAQSSLTFSLGDGASATRYLAAGNTGLQTALVPVVAAGAGYVVGTATNDNYLLLTTAGAAGTTGSISCAILYSVD